MAPVNGMRRVKPNRLTNHGKRDYNEIKPTYLCSDDRKRFFTRRPVFLSVGVYYTWKNEKPRLSTLSETGESMCVAHTPPLFDSDVHSYIPGIRQTHGSGDIRERDKIPGNFEEKGRKKPPKIYVFFPLPLFTKYEGEKNGVTALTLLCPLFIRYGSRFLDPVPLSPPRPSCTRNAGSG